MHLSKMAVQSFRSLKDVTVDLRPGLNVLVGPNNVGKTNLFDAVRHALGPTASRSDPLWLDKDDRHRDKAGVVSSETIYVQLVFSELNDDDRAQFFELVDFQQGLDIEKAEAKVNFEAVWNEKLGRFQTNRWGGSPEGERGAVPNELLEALSVVFMPALRDAKSALTPGNRSVLARVLDELSRRDDVNHDASLEAIFERANSDLEKEDLVKTVQGRLRDGAQQMAGVDYLPASVKAADPKFGRILRTLRIVVDSAPIEDVSASGLGYSNVLYMATVLSHLEQPPGRDCPVVLIEEPEAHLSPQLTVLLAKHLSKLRVPQVFVSTHSPTFASCVDPSQVLILGGIDDQQACTALHESGLEEAEERQLKRMLDITRATLYFCKGLILVEGISEALLLPALAERSGVDLAQLHISVLPICGVSFVIFEKLFSQEGMSLPVAIITDADPKVDKGKNWKTDLPRVGEECDRVIRLRDIFAGHENVEVCVATVTLEYDLAEAGENNPEAMATVWEECFVKMPGTLSKKIVANAGSHEEQVLAVWRGICRAEHTGSKADFANLLAGRIARQEQKSKAEGHQEQKTTTDEQDTEANTGNEFKVPGYITRAIKHVVPSPATHEDSQVL